MTVVFPWTLAYLTNQTRVTQNLNPLAVNPLLNFAAQMKANDMARKGYFAHTSPKGLTPWYWFWKAGYSFEYAGENLAVDFIDPAAIEDAWMASPSHNANLIDAHYTEVGTGMAYGTLDGKKVMYIAQVYANPARTFY